MNNEKNQRKKILSAPQIKIKIKSSSSQNRIERSNIVRRNLNSGNLQRVKICKSIVESRLQPTNRNRMKTAVRKTIVFVARNQMETTRQEVMRELQLDELTHNLHLYNSGIEFILRSVPETSELFTLLATDKIFWNWYRNEWKHAQIAYLKKHETFMTRPVKIINMLYCADMEFHCIHSQSIMQSFDNFLKIHTR
jgi:hypothetical protein